MKRTRNQFIETVQYAGVSASSPFPWYYRASIERPTNPARPRVLLPLQQNNDYAAKMDNEVKAGTTKLTSNLEDSAIQAFGDGARVTPASLKRPPVLQRIKTPGTIEARGLGQGIECARFAQFTKVEATGTGTRVATFLFEITTFADAKLTGTWNLPGQAFDPNSRFFRTPLGTYNVRIYIGDRMYPEPGFAGPTINVEAQ